MGPDIARGQRRCERPNSVQMEFENVALSQKPILVVRIPLLHDTPVANPVDGVNPRGNGNGGGRVESGGIVRGDGLQVGGVE